HQPDYLVNGKRQNHDAYGNCRANQNLFPSFSSLKFFLPPFFHFHFPAALRRSQMLFFICVHSFLSPVIFPIYRKAPESDPRILPDPYWQSLCSFLSGSSDAFRSLQACRRPLRSVLPLSRASRRAPGCLPQRGR